MMVLSQIPRKTRSKKSVTSITPMILRS